MKVAVPAEFNCPVPTLALFDRNVTEPVGMDPEAALVTVAVRTTLLGGVTWVVLTSMVVVVDVSEDELVVDTVIPDDCDAAI